MDTRLLYFVFQTVNQMLLQNYHRRQSFSCDEMIIWVIQPFRGYTRLASPLGDPKMPTKRDIYCVHWKGIGQRALFWPMRNIQLDNKMLPHHLLLLSPVFSMRDMWAGTSFDVINAVPWNPVEWLWLAPAKDLGHGLSGEPSCLRAIVNASCLLQFSTKPYRSCPHNKTTTGAEPLFNKGLLPAFARFPNQWQELKNLQCAQCQLPLIPDIQVWPLHRVILK